MAATEPDGASSSAIFRSESKSEISKFVVGETRKALNSVFEGGKLRLQRSARQRRNDLKVNVDLENL